MGLFSLFLPFCMLPFLAFLDHKQDSALTRGRPIVVTVGNAGQMVEGSGPFSVLDSCRDFVDLYLLVLDLFYTDLLYCFYS